MKTNCKWTKELSAYRDGELSPSRQSKIKAHLKECAICREQLDFWAATSQFIKTAPAPVPSTFMWTRIQAEMANPASGKLHIWEQPWVTRRLPSPLQTMIVALILVATFFSIQPFITKIESNLYANSNSGEVDMSTYMTTETPESILGI
jgi:anti-sigma factor RsiW